MHLRQRQTAGWLWLNPLKLLVFLCLIRIAAENKPRSKGNITSHDNSGTEGVAVGDKVGVADELVGVVVDGVGAGVEALGLSVACEFGASKMGKKFIVPKLKSYLKSYIVWLID